MEARRFPRAALVAAVAPARLETVLEGLLVGGLLVSYRSNAHEIELTGDFRALEVAIEMGDQHAFTLPAAPADHRPEYFQACRAYIGTGSYYRLSPQHREIWRRHANGESHQRIAQHLGVTLMKIRVAVRGARLAARLPAATSAMPRGGREGGRPRVPDSKRRRCRCGKFAEARGLCMPHYLQAWRAGTLPERETGT
jgi:hypothetical protein